MHAAQINEILKRYENCEKQFKDIAEDILRNDAVYRAAAFIAKNVLISFTFYKSKAVYTPTMRLIMYRNYGDGEWTKGDTISPASGYNPLYIKQEYREIGGIEWFKDKTMPNDFKTEVYESVEDGRTCNYIYEMAKPFPIQRITDESFLSIHNALVNRRFEEALGLSKEEFNRRFAKEVIDELKS